MDNTTILEAQMERRLYRRMIDMGVDGEVSMKMMALWLWLESQGGFKDIVRKICSHDDDKFLAMVCVEAEAALAYLDQAGSPATPISPVCIPITTNLVNSSFSDHLHDIFMNKERVSKGVSDLFDGVCTMLFKDILEDERVDSVEVGKVMGKMMRPRFGEGVSQEGAMLGDGGSLRSTNPEDGKKLGLPSSGVDGTVAAPRVQLDPSAKEWSPFPERASEEDRCLYLTFSNGFPLTESEISSFFIRKYGACVESVYVHRPEPWNRQPWNRAPPLFGKIVFNASFIPALIMNGQKQAKFVVNGRTLWCKKFTPKNSRNCHDHGEN